MSALERIHDAIAARVVADHAGWITSSNIRYGGGETHRHRSPPEILVVPGSEETWLAPEQIGAQTYLAASDELRVSRVIYSLASTWQVRFWGADRRQTEQLRQAWLLAVLAEAGDVVAPQSGAWTTEHDDAGDVTLGAQYTLTVTVTVSVTDDPADLSTVPPGAATWLSGDGFLHRGSLGGDTGCGDT